MSNIFYKADTIVSFRESFFELYNYFLFNDYKQKIFINNLRDKNVLGTTLDINVDRIEKKNFENVRKNKYTAQSNNYDQYQELIMYETLDHVETLSNELQETHRNYVKEKKNNNEGVLFKIGIPSEKIMEVYETKTKLKKLLKSIYGCIKPQGYTLPYVQILVKEGKKYFTYILLIDRQYYKDSIVIKSNNKSIRYKLHGKFVSKDKALALRNEGILVDTFEVGELTFESKKNWSSKVTDSWFGSLSSLEAKRLHYISMLKDIFNIHIIPIKKLLKNRSFKDRKHQFKNWKVILYNNMYWWLYRKNIAINTLINTINSIYNQGLLKSLENDYKNLVNLLEKQRLNCQQFEMTVVKLVNRLNTQLYLDDEDVYECINCVVS